MYRSSNMRIVLCVVMGILSLWRGVCLARSEARPNILFIMSDDHTTQAFGAYGSRLAPLNPTPNIDRLAREGMLFENCFCNN